MPVPGIYLVNSTGEMSVLANERGEGDRKLLIESLEEHGMVGVREVL